MFLVAKPTMQCNAACAYCAARTRADSNTRMAPAVLEKLFAFAGYLGREHSSAEGGRLGVTMLWHGGEPLLMGPEFYEQVHVLTRSLSGQGVTVRHRMQTNLLAWNENLAEVLSRLLHDRRLSSSAEPLGLGDRRLPGGASYMGRWLEKVDEVRKAGFRPGLVCVVDGRIAAHPRETYYYFKNLATDAHVRFNPIYPHERGRQTTGKRRLAQSAWAGFLTQLWDVWEGEVRPFGIEPLQTWANVAGNRRQRGACDMSGRCATGFLGVGPEGDVHQCGRAIDAGVLRYGNLVTDSFEQILAAPERARMLARTDELSTGACRDCPWWGLCHGGCPVQAWLHGKDWHEPTHWCESRRAFFEHAFGHHYAEGAHAG